MDLIETGPLAGLSATPARRAAAASMACVAAKDRAGWLALMSPDVVVEDPVGPSMLDTKALGHVGHEAVGAFWDITIANIDVAFDIRESHGWDREVANVGTIVSTFANGSTLTTEGVFVYRVDDAGLLVSLRAHWDFDRSMATLTAPAP